MERYFYFDRTKSIEALEENNWDNPTYESNLVLKVDELRKKPLNQLTASELRILIGQKIAMSFVVALAIEELEDNVLVESDLYSGDLLNVVSEIGNEFWSKNPELKDDFEKILINAIENLNSKFDLFKQNTYQSKQ